ncbi:MAG: TolC family protein [Verrucomicrobiota bacterium]
MIFKLGGILFSLLLATLSSAETLSQLRREALRQHPHLQAARLAVAVAQARLRDAGRLSNPSLLARWEGDVFQPDRGSGEWELGLAHSFPLADRLRREREVSLLDIERARIELVSKALDLLREIDENAALQGDLIHHAAQFRTALEVAENLTAFTENASARGEASVLDARKAAIEAGRLRIELRETEAEREQAGQALAILVGRPPGDSVLLTSPPHGDPSLPALPE